MKKIMVLVTVAMMGAGFSGNVSAVDVKSIASSMMKPVLKIIGDPVVGVIIMGELKDALVKDTKSRLKLTPGETKSLDDSFDSIIDLLQSKARK